MVKQILSILLIILLSIGVVLSLPKLQQVPEMLLSMHSWISNSLSNVFSGAEAGSLIRQTIALLVIPLIIGFIPTVLFLLFRRSWFPYFMQTVWVIWLVQTSALIVQYKIV